MAELLFPLTPREKEVLALVVAGLSNRQIARELGCKLATIKGHNYRINRKLDCESRVQVAVFAVRHNLVEQHPTPR